MVLVLDWKQAQTARLRRLSLQCRTSGSTVHVATKCLNLRPIKTAAVHGLPSPYCEPRIWYYTQSHRSLFTHLLETVYVVFWGRADYSGERVISPELRPTRSPDLKEQRHFSAYINVIPSPWRWRWKDRPKRRCQRKTIHDFKTLKLPSEVLLKLTEIQEGL
jgi:hypothetical protein